jgi:hypothetical protein
VHEEAVVFDGNEGVLQVRRDGGDRHVVALFVEPEPALAVGGVEPGVADAARQLVDIVALLANPAEHCSARDENCVEQILRAPQIRAP